MHQRLRSVRDGKVACYIPELAKASQDSFGICIATVDGRLHEVGDSRELFTIQSISKPLVYGFALDSVGEEAVHRKVGVEPTGESFNSISLEPGTGRPLNPMINAGAIATTSLVPGATAAERLRSLLDLFARYVGHEVDVDQQVYRSESETGHRNRAIGHMLRNFGVLGEDPDLALELYFKQCSLRVDCRDLAMIGATLAAGGTNPLTGERAVRRQHVQRILSVMTFAGMYDFAGGWGFRVGLPAKSGVGGGILAVLPGQLGIGVFSPPLDEKGNSTRGIRVCEELSERFKLNALNVAQTPPAIRARFDGTSIASRRQRRPDLEEFLKKYGASIQILELQGQLRFAAAEKVVAEVEAKLVSLRYLLFDLRHVVDVDSSARELISRLGEKLCRSGKTLALVSVAHLPELWEQVQALVPADAGGRVLCFEDRDSALEWCENDLATSRGWDLLSSWRIPVSESELLSGVAADETDHLTALLTAHCFPPGARILGQGEPADSVLLLVKGEVRVVANTESARTRLTTLSAGATLGEGAALGEARRSADAYAETEVVCLALSVVDFEELGKTHPRLQARLLRNMLGSVLRIARRLTSEVTALSNA